ncbi:hypothetical protein PYW07_013096 [Mythimna separata]|uniref:Peptidase S1 domain-containing protein n=1 Tax=Mythimna separata TaxID=271217 RepID=A0AAD7Y5P3_MYTSE|nr:hypothetical protein PYW07_013096 [Mythimna separata]
MREHPPICTFKGKEPVVCCTDCTIVEDVRNIIFNPKTELLSMTGQKANDKCVNFVDKLDYDCKLNTRANYTRVFDPNSNCYEIGVNTETMPVVMPAPRESYLALLGYGNDINTAQWLCAGTIISEKFILTAAECLTKENVGSVRYVAVGIQKRTDPPRLWPKYNVKRIIAHPEYQPPSRYNDIGLLETTETITFSRAVLPACLHSDPNSTEVFAEANILVFDKNGNDQGSLKQVTLRQFDEFQCSIFYPPHAKLAKGYSDASQICYGDTKGPVDSCQMDSGSPLMATSKLFECAASILGVTSFERTCGTAGSSGLFTKVIHYIPWIESIVWS